MRSKGNLKMVGKPHRRQECRSHKKKKKIQVQFVVCRRQCQTTPSVKRVMKRLSSTRKSCKIPEWKRRSILPSKTLKTKDNANIQSKEEENVTKTTTCTGFKFSNACETILVQTGSEIQRKKRKESMLSSLGLDSSIIPRQEWDPEKQNILSPCVKESSDTTQTDKAAATTSEKQLPNTSGPQKLRKCKTGDKAVPEHIPRENPRTSANTKKKGRKKVDTEDLLLQQMIQCCKMLQGSCSDSHRHIAQLLSQEIEKAKEGELTTAPEGSYGQNFNDNSANCDETVGLGVDDNRIDSPVLEDIAVGQVLEIEATFLVKASAERGQEISGVSLLAPTMLFSGVEMELNCVTEDNNANGGSNGALNENTHEVLSLVPSNLSPQNTQPKSEPHSCLSDHILPESFSLDPHYTMSELEPCSPHNIQPVPYHTPPESHSSIQNHIQTEPHPSISSHTQPEPHLSIPSHTQLEAHSSIPSHTQPEPHPSIPSHTQPEPHSSIPSQMQPEPHPSIPSHTQPEPHSSIPSQTQPESHPSIPNHTQQEPQYAVPNHTQPEHHYTVINHTQPEHHCSPSHSIQEKSPFVLHSIKSEPNSCLPNHSEIVFNVSIPQGNPTEPHSSVLDHTPTELHSADLQGNQREPFSVPHHTQLESLSVHSHSTQKDTCSLLSHHLQTEPHSSEPEHNYPSCAPPKKKRQKKSSQKSTCNYNLRSKDLKNNMSEMDAATQLKNMNILLKTHCKNKPQLCLRKLEYDPSNVANKNTESQKLSQHTHACNVSSMSLPVSIPVQFLNLPNGQKDVIEVAERDDDSQEGEGVGGRYQEEYSGSNKMACIETDMEWTVYKQSDKERLVHDTEGGMDAKSCERVVDAESCLGDTSTKNSVRETDTVNTHGGGTDTESFFKEISADNCQKMEVDENNQKKTRPEDSEMMMVTAEKYLEASVIEGHQMELLGAGNSQKETSGESHQMEILGAEKSQGGTSIESGLMEVEGTENSQEETDMEGCQMVVVGAENSQEGADVEGCYTGLVYAENSQEGTDSEGCHVVVGAENSQERTDAEECQMEVVSAGNSSGGTGAESQVDDESINALMPSLYGDGNSDFDVHNITLLYDQKCKFSLDDFHTKQKPNLDQVSLSDDAEPLGVSTVAPVGEDFCLSVVEQSEAFCQDKGKNAKKANENCPPARDKILLCQRDCVSDADLYDSRHLFSQTRESNLVTQYVHHMTDEAQLLNDLESAVEDWAVQSNAEGPNVTVKDSTLDVKYQAQESPEGQGDLREDTESPIDPTSTSLCQVLNIQNDRTNLTEEENWRAINNEESAESDGEDVLSIYTDSYSLLGSEASGEDSLSEADDKDVEDKTNSRERSLDSKSEGMAADVKHNVLTDSAEHNMSCDGLEASGSDEALSPSDSDEESLQSKSSIIDRIVENDTRCSLEDSLEDNTLKNLPSGDKENKSIKVKGCVEVSKDGEEVITSSSLLYSRNLFKNKSNHKESPEIPCLPESISPLKSGSPCWPKPCQSQWNPTPTKDKKPEKRSCRDQEVTQTRSICDKDPFEVCVSDEDLLPSPTLAEVSPPPPPSFKSKNIRVPRPSLPQNLGICFFFINRGFCDRHDCIYSHKLTLECESYLGLLMLHYVSDHREDQAWNILGAHLTHSGYSLSLAVSLLLPLARYLVEHNHNKQRSNIRVPSSFTLPLDIAKVRILCEGHQGQAAFNLLYSCHSSASPEGLQTLLNIFIRFCESCPEKNLLSPWEKVVLWGYDCYGGAAEAKLKDKFNMEWLRIHMLGGNADKVWKVYMHLSQALTVPSTFFTHITCQVISFYNDIGRLQDSFHVLGEVRRLRANSSTIFTALIPADRKCVQEVIKELQELGQLVCELCVLLSSSSWSLLLSHMMDIDDLSQALELVLMQINFMTPEVEILKRLLEECIAKGPILLQPLCNIVCMLPGKVLGQLQVSLRCLMNACNHASPSQHMKSLIIQHCWKFGIKLMSQTHVSASLVEEQSEPCQSDSPILHNNNNNSSISISFTTSNSNSSNWKSRGELQDHTPSPGFVDIDNEGSTCETSGHAENTVADGKSVQDLIVDNMPAMYGQSEVPLPPSPKSLPPSDRAESVINHGLKEIKSKALTPAKSVQHDEQVTTRKEHQHHDHQQSLVEYCHQQPSIVSLCNSNTQDKSVANMRVKNTSLDLENFLMSPESTDISLDINDTKTKREEDSPSANKKVGKLSQSLSHQGSHVVQSGHCHGFNARHATCSTSTHKDFRSFNETLVPKTHVKVVETLENNSVLQDPEKVPQFRIIKKIRKFPPPKNAPDQYLRSHASRHGEGSGYNCVPPLDETTCLDLEDNCDQVGPLKFPQIAQKVMKMFSRTTTTMQNVQLNSWQSMRNSRYQQSVSSQQIQQGCGRNNSPDKFSGCSGNPFNMQQNQWFQLEKVGPLDHSRQSSPTLDSSPSCSSGFSDPYFHSSPASHQSSKMSLRSEYGERDGESNELGSNVLLLHEIASMEDQKEKKQKVAELAVALTGGSNIYSSGTKFYAIMKTCKTSVPSHEEREVMGAIGVLVMVECVRHKILSEAELVILGLHHHRLPFFSNLISWDESYSEQQLAVMALNVLHHMKNYNLFVTILEETSWSGSADDIKARLKLLSEVLDRQLDSGKSQFSLWYIGRILASLVTYYNYDTMMLHTYHDLLDLPSHLETSWIWVDACGGVEVVEQFTVILSTALRLGLPLSQHFTYKLMNKGIGVESMDMSVVPERGFGRPPVPQQTQRTCASRKWKSKARRVRAMEGGNKKKRGSYRGTFRHFQQQGKFRGQAALGRKQN